MAIKFKFLRLISAGQGVSCKSCPAAGHVDTVRYKTWTAYAV